MPINGSNFWCFRKQNWFVFSISNWSKMRQTIAFSLLQMWTKRTNVLCSKRQTKKSASVGWNPSLMQWFKPNKTAKENLKLVLYNKLLVRRCTYTYITVSECFHHNLYVNSAFNDYRHYLLELNLKQALWNLYFQLPNTCFSLILFLSVEHFSVNITKKQNYQTYTCNIILTQ